MRFNIRSLHVAILQPPSNNPRSIPGAAARQHPSIINCLSKRHKPMPANPEPAPDLPVLHLHPALIPLPPKNPIPRHANPHNLLCE
jgi:hypothetical protein